MKKKVYFRVDGNHEIGLGHLFRCFALAQMLEDLFCPAFYCKYCPMAFEGELLRKGWNYFHLNNEDEFFDVLLPNDIVVLDGYNFKNAYQTIIRGEKKCKLVYIDDLRDGKMDVDLLINHSPKVLASDYNVAPYTQLALGLDFVLLRKCFLEGAKLFDKAKIPNKIIVCFGGSDPSNLTFKVLSILFKDCNYRYDVTAIIGASYRWESSLTTFEEFKNCKIMRNVDEYTMSSMMLQASIAIVPASGVLQEAIACGCYIITCAYVENQYFLLDGYRDYQGVIALDHLSKDNIKASLGKVESLSRPRLPRLIDGNSGKRILKYFVQFAKEPNCYLRRIEVSDFDRTFSWASNESVRAYSYNKQPIDVDTHYKWFIKKISEVTTCFYFMFIFNNQEVGTLRLDKSGKKLKISYLIDPLYQGGGLGVIILRKSLEFLVDSNWCGCSCIYGDVMFENIPSVKAFEKLNFQKKVLNEKSIRFYKLKNENWKPSNIQR